MRWTLTFGLSMLLAGTAAAQMNNYNKRGTWNNYRGKVENGATVCGATTTIAMEGGRYREYQSLHFKYAFHDQSLMVQIFRQSWNISTIHHTSLEIAFDRVVWKRIDDATGNMFTVPKPSEPGSMMIGTAHFLLRDDGIKSFFDAFKSGNEMTIKFPGTIEQPMKIPLGDDSRDVATEFLRCSLELKPPSLPSSAEGRRT